MLVIRLRRVGKKNQPAFKIIVTEKKKAPTKGVFLEEVGFWNPLTKERILKVERIKHWISVGAQASDTLHNMLITEKVIEGEKIKKHRKSKKTEEEKKKEVKTEVKAEEPKKEVKEEIKKEEPKEVKKEIKEEIKEEVKEEKKEDEKDKDAKTEEKKEDSKK